jgi:glycosyl transferase family 11
MNVLFQGGLGNCMFQWAFGRSLSLRHGVSLTFDRSYIDTDKKRPYRLDRYLDADFAPSTGLPVYREKGCPYDPAALTANPNSHFIGYWQTEKYFNVEEVRKAFARPRGTPNAATLDVVSRIDDKSCFIHARRGDFTAACLANILGCYPPSHYQNAMKQFSASTKFFAFSDDPQWCRVHMPEAEVVTANQEDGLECWDIWLMNQFPAGIISNGSFSWWSAWLGREKRVIAPKVWFTGLDYRDCVPERWERL